MAMIVHEEGPPVGNEGGVFVPFLLVFLVLPATTLADGLRGAGRVGAHDKRSGRLGRRCSGVVELELLHRLGTVADGKALKHGIGIGYRFVVGGRRGVPGSMLRGSISCRLPCVRGDGGGLVDVASIAIVAVIVVVTNDGTLGHGVVIEVELIRTTFSIFLILDASSMTNLSASGGRHVFGSSRRAIWTFRMLTRR